MDRFSRAVRAASLSCKVISRPQDSPQGVASPLEFRFNRMFGRAQDGRDFRRRGFGDIFQMQYLTMLRLQATERAFYDFVTLGRVLEGWKGDGRCDARATR